MNDEDHIQAERLMENFILETCDDLQYEKSSHKDKIEKGLIEQQEHTQERNKNMNNDNKEETSKAWLVNYELECEENPITGNCWTESEVKQFVCEDQVESDPFDPSDWLDDFVHYDFRHRRYNFHRNLEFDDSDDFEEFMNKEIEKEDKSDYVFIPVWMYEHSGIALSFEPFACRFDSGLLGYIYYNKKSAVKGFGFDYTPENCISVDSSIRAAAKEYFAYIEDDVRRLRVVYRNIVITQSDESLYGIDLDLLKQLKTKLLESVKSELTVQTEFDFE